MKLSQNTECPVSSIFNDNLMLDQNLIELEIGKLRLAEEKFYKIFDLNPCPMSVHRLSDDIILDVNNTFLITLGVKSKFDIVGKNVFELKLGLVKQEDRKFLFEKVIENNIFENYLLSFKNVQGKKNEWCSFSNNN